MTDAYTISLAREYLDTIRQIENGQFGSRQQLHELESNRSVLHDQLQRAIGKRIKKDDMPDYARKLVRG
jgi:hypothetical protein